MPQTVRIAIDLMGGDNGPEPLVPGASIARERRPDLWAAHTVASPAAAP